MGSSQSSPSDVGKTKKQSSKWEAALPATVRKFTNNRPHPSGGSTWTALLRSRPKRSKPHSRLTDEVLVRQDRTMIAEKAQLAIDRS